MLKSLHFSFHSDGYMLAAVGDGTSLIYSSSNWKLYQKLQHPSYVYTGQFHPATSSVVVTAGFDRVIRIWRRERDTYTVTQVLIGLNLFSGYMDLFQELTGHSTHINCVCFDIDGQFLFSGDNKGTIKMWESPEGHATGFESSTDSFAHLKNKIWSFKREFLVDGMDSGPVCKVAPHPGGRRLLVHTLHPSCPLKMLDLRTGSVMQSYTDIQNFRLPASSLISPCGSWVVGGSDCGVVLVWNTDTGEKKTIIRDMMYDKQVSAVVFHPLEHAMAIASVEPNSKVGKKSFIHSIVSSNLSILGRSVHL